MQENNGNKNNELKLMFFLDFHDSPCEGSQEKVFPLTSGDE